MIPKVSNAPKNPVAGQQKAANGQKQHSSNPQKTLARPKKPAAGNSDAVTTQPVQQKPGTGKPTPTQTKSAVTSQKSPVSGQQKGSAVQRGPVPAKKSEVIQPEKFLPITTRLVKNVQINQNMKVIEARATDTVREVFSLLQKNDILSLPIYNPEKGDYLGMLYIWS